MATPNYVMMIKDKGVTPTNSNLPIYQVFVYDSVQNMFNNVFRRDVLNRFLTWAHVSETSFRSVSGFMEVWASSKYPDDTLFDSTLPQPNTKDFVWKSDMVNAAINKERFDITSENRSRKRMNLYRLNVKSQMIQELISVPCFVLDMRKDTLNKALRAGGVNIDFSFKV